MSVLAVVLAGATFFSTLAGGFAALRWPSRVEWLMALAGGVVLGAALFDLLPEAIEHGEEHGLEPIVPLGAVLAGYLVFNAAERFAHRHEDCGHHHEHAPGAAVPSSAGIVGAAGFVAHSFFDGLAIGIGFQVDQAVGVLIALAVIGHDFSDGLNTVSLLQAARHSTERSQRWLLAVAIAPFFGAIVGSVVTVPDEVLPITLGFFSGLFLYAASTHLLPAAHRLPALGSFLVTSVGAAAMLAIALAAHH